MLVDSHCHLDRVDLTPYDNDFDRFMGETRRAGVSHMLCVCIDLEHFGEMAELTAPYEDVSISVGVHPNEQGGQEPGAETLVDLAADRRVVAIGETGLDYYRSKGDMSWQHTRFRNHIAAAKATGKPLIIHTRDAREDTIRIMREESAGEAGGVMHCFTETWEMAEQALDLGFYISFSGIVTFKNAAALREVAKRTPEDRLLIETDSPYLAPVPYRGKPNEPRYVAHVAACIAEVRGVEVDALVSVTADNFARLFSHASMNVAGGIPGTTDQR